MVDEFQDTNDVQIQLIERMNFAQSSQYCRGGDDDQSIYGWRGAVVSNILDFPKIFLAKWFDWKETTAVLLKFWILRMKWLQKSKAAWKGFKGTKKLGLWKFRGLRCWKWRGRIRTGGPRNSSLEKGRLWIQGYSSPLSFNGQGGWLEANLRPPYDSSSSQWRTSFLIVKKWKIFWLTRCSLGTQDVFIANYHLPSRGIGMFPSKPSISMPPKIKWVLKVALDWRRACVAEKVGRKHRCSFRLVEGGQDYESLIQCHGRRRTAEVLMEIGYQELVYKSSDDPLGRQNAGWWSKFFQSLDGFVQRGAMDVATLKDFVDAMELRDDVESEYEKIKIKSVSMTLHACKGLNFPPWSWWDWKKIFYLTKLWEVILRGTTFYVGITRAQRELVMSRAQFRKRHGALRPSAPSRFLLEVSPGHYQHFPDGVRPVSGCCPWKPFAKLPGGFGSKIQSKT